MKKFLSGPGRAALLCALCLASMLLGAACGAGEPAPTASAAVTADGDTLGRGEKSFALTIADAEGAEITVTVNTDAEFLGDALLACGLIEGEEGPYGLYIKAVNGLWADYDTDGTYWAFYENGELALTGVASAPVQDGGAYALRVEK